MEVLAEVAEFYGGGSLGGLAYDDLVGLHANIPRLKARRTLEQAVNGKVRLSPDEWYDAVLLATGDERAANRAHWNATRALQKVES